MAFSPPEYCMLFAQKKTYQGGVTGTPGPPPPLATPLTSVSQGIGGPYQMPFKILYFVTTCG